MVVDVANLVPVVETTMDGTSGALYAIFLNSLVHSLKAEGTGTATPQTWAAALKRSCDALGRYTPARPGDRPHAILALKITAGTDKLLFLPRSAETARAA